MTTKESNKQNYIADFFQSNAKNVYINIHLPPPYRGKGSWAAEVGFTLERGDQLEALKHLFGKIKLHPFDIENKTFKERSEFYFSDACPEFGMHVEFDDRSYVLICVKDSLKNSLGTNLSVQYYSHTQSGKIIRKCFTALIPDEEEKEIIESANNMFDKYVKKRQGP